MIAQRRRRKSNRNASDAKRLQLPTVEGVVTVEDDCAVSDVDDVAAETVLGVEIDVDAVEDDVDDAVNVTEME